MILQRRSIGKARNEKSREINVQQRFVPGFFRSSNMRVICKMKAMMRKLAQCTSGYAVRVFCGCRSGLAQNVTMYDARCAMIVAGDISQDTGASKNIISKDISQRELIE